MKSNYLPIKRIYLKRFRSIPQATIDLKNPLFLVGKNGAGKSNLLKAFDFISECMTQPLSAVLEKQGGLNAIRYRSEPRSRPGNFAVRVDFDFQNGNPAEGYYAFEIKAKAGYEFEVLEEKCVVRNKQNDRFYFHREKITVKTNIPGIDPAVDPQSLLLPLIGGNPQLVPVTKGLSGMKIFSIQPQVILELQEPDSGLSLRSDGGNLASVLKALINDPDSKNRLFELLKSVVPGTDSVRPKKHGKMLSLEFHQKWDDQVSRSVRTVAHEAFSMSDGTLRALGILLAFMQKNRPILIGLEEPEATIHPEALSCLLELIRGFSKETQILVTTHSPELLDAKWIEPENLRIVSWDKGITQVRPLGEAAKTSLRDHLMGAGELLRSNALQAVDNFFDDNDSTQLDLFND